MDGNTNPRRGTKKRQRLPQSTAEHHEKALPSPATPKKLLSQMTAEEVRNLTEDEYDDLLTEQMIHNIRTHTPDR